MSNMAGNVVEYDESMAQSIVVLSCTSIKYWSIEISSNFRRNSIKIEIKSASEAKCIKRDRSMGPILYWYARYRHSTKFADWFSTTCTATHRWTVSLPTFEKPISWNSIVNLNLWMDFGGCNEVLSVQLRNARDRRQLTVRHDVHPKSRKCARNMLMTYKLPSNLKIRLCVFVRSHSDKLKWIQKATNRLKLNQKKNFYSLTLWLVYVSLDLSLVKREIRNTENVITTPMLRCAFCQYTAFRITFNYYCIKSDKGFSLNWAGTQIVAMGYRARAYTP